MLQVEMEFLNSYICKFKERKFQNAGEKTSHSRAQKFLFSEIFLGITHPERMRKRKTSVKRKQTNRSKK